MVDYISLREYQKMSETARMYYLESVTKIQNREKRDFYKKLIDCCTKAPDMIDELDEKARELMKIGRYDKNVIEKIVMGHGIAKY